MKAIHQYYRIAVPVAFATDLLPTVYCSKMFMLLAASPASAGPASTTGKNGSLTARVQGQRMVLVNWLCDKPDAPKELFPCMFSEHIKTTRAITDAAQRSAANEKWTAYLATPKARQAGNVDFWKMHTTYCAQEAQSKWSISQLVITALRPRTVRPTPTEASSRSLLDQA